MNSVKTTAVLCLFFLFTLISPFPLIAESPLGEEPISAEEPVPAEETLFSDEPILAEEPISGEAPVPAEEPILAEESVPGEEALTEESISDEEAFFSEEFFADDGSFIFEASPLIFETAPFHGIRSFDEIFPSLSQGQKMNAMRSRGLRHSFEKDGSPTLIPESDSGINLLDNVMTKKPSHIIEALMVVPYNERELDMLDVYNALGKIKEIKDHTLHYNGKDYNIFAETTRLESPRNRKPIPDPAPADTLPPSETMYLRFIDPYIGDLYIRGEISVSLYGLTYSMTNFADVRYSVFRIMKAERFSIMLYLEPVKEGILIYSMSGIYLPNFIANRLNLSGNINNRITVLVSWITDGLRKQEIYRKSERFYRLPENP